MNISDLKKCTDCGACRNICPKNAISIDEDGLFYSPKVDQKLCIDCGMCIKVCPLEREMHKTKPFYAFGEWHKDDKVVLKSSSGGAFFGLAQKIAEEGGIVFGAEYSDDCKKVVFSSTDKTPLERLMKSKYVESLTGISFREIKTELENGRKVLFCGTPCQAAGLSGFLGKEYENLVICDFACGGLPSHEIFSEYLNGLEKKYRSRIKNVDFRPKTHGWKRYAVKVDFENGKSYNRLGVEDEFLRSFLYGKCMVRDYCLECKFSEYHASDITIADFWLHDKLSDLRNDDGISLVLCNTEKGKKILDSVNGSYIYKEIDAEKASYNNKQTVTSEKNAEKRRVFLDEYKNRGLSSAYKKVFSDSAQDKLKNTIARIMYRNKKV